tara:strand:+ start:219 stop:1406 length:1188 start_codon:yes stop_codon:yes gene_type:complete
MAEAATNLLNTEETFILRRLYQEDIYPKWGPKSIDYWYDKGLYGRLDREENVVLPKLTSIKQLRSADENSYFALDFVVDAFDSMRTAFEKGMIKNTVRVNGSAYSAMRPGQAWDNGDELYLTYLQIMDDDFVQNHLIQLGLTDSIKSFKDYFHKYITYIENRAGTFPITKSSFIASKYSSPYVSGLIIELNKENHADDLPKKEVYINDPNFNIFRNTAQQFGFMIDTNAPWRLTADLASSFMQGFGEKYGVELSAGSASNVFDTHYDLLYNEDLNLLKRFFLASYETFVETYPLLQEERTVKCNDSFVIDVTKVPRTPYDQAAYLADYDEVFWLKLYTNFRLKEGGIVLTNRRKNVIIKKISNLFPYVGAEKTVKVINNSMITLSPNRWWAPSTS